MEIRVLKYFLTVAKTENITKAANVLHLTQPTLSRQLQDLEKELGHKLFIRGNHNISLTAEGIVFRKRAEEIMELVEKTEKEFSLIKDDVSGDIFIDAGETKSIKIVADIIKTLNKKYPKIKFHIVSGDSNNLEEKLDKGILDFCILIQPFNLEKYDFINLPEKDIWGILLRNDDELAKKKNIKITDLLKLPLIVSRQPLKQSAGNNIFTDWFGDNLKKLNITGTYNLIYNAAIMTKHKIGYALGLDRLIKDTADSSLCFRPLSPKLEVTVSVAWKKNHIFSKPAKLFFDELIGKFSKNNPEKF